MDITNLAHRGPRVLSFATFIGILAWAFAPARSRGDFEDASAACPSSSELRHHERLHQRLLVDLRGPPVAGQHPGLRGCLLWLTPARRAPAGDPDNTTGHVWDEDLREMNNPMPRWWMWLFVITIVFAAGLPGRCTRAWAATRASSAWTTDGEYAGRARQGESPN